MMMSSQVFFLPHISWTWSWRSQQPRNINKRRTKKTPTKAHSNQRIRKGATWKDRKHLNSNCSTPTKHHRKYCDPHPHPWQQKWVRKPRLLPLQDYNERNSLVTQWLRIHLPVQGTQVRALVWEDSTCCGPTKPVHHNYWACALEPASHSYWAHVPQLLKPTHLEPMLRNKRSHCNEKPAHRN